MIILIVCMFVRLGVCTCVYAMEYVCYSVSNYCSNNVRSYNYRHVIIIIRISKDALTHVVF